MKKIFPLFLVYLIAIGSFAQNGSIGMGTETPNPNAVLDLVSPDNNQGLLVPRLTSEQRLDSTFVNRLDSIDDGLLVFDIDENQFYYWDRTGWSNFAGASTQSLSFDEQTFELTLTGGNSVSLSVFVDEYDSDSTNELQTLSYANDSLFLSNGGGSVGLDTSNTNEIQDLQLTGTNLSITNNPSATDIDLTPFVANTDEQTLSFDDATNELTISGGNTVDLSSLVGGEVNNDPDSTNEIQDLAISGDTLTITNNASATEIDLSTVDNQTLDLSGNTLSIEDGNSVDLSGFGPVWSQIGSTVFYDAGDVRVDNRFITTPSSNIVNVNTAGFTLSTTNTPSRVVLITTSATGGVSITNISAGQNGQELILVGASGTSGVPVTNGGNIELGTSPRTLLQGSVLKLIYMDNIGSWIETSYVN